MSMVGSLIAHVCMHARLALQYVTDKQQLGMSCELFGAWNISYVHAILEREKRKKDGKGYSPFC